MGAKEFFIEYDERKKLVDEFNDKYKPMLRLLNGPSLGCSGVGLELRLSRVFPSKYSLNGKKYTNVYRHTYIGHEEFKKAFERVSAYTEENIALWRLPINENIRDNYITMPEKLDEMRGAGYEVMINTARDRDWWDVTAWRDNVGCDNDGGRLSASCKILDGAIEMVYASFFKSRQQQQANK